MLIRISLIVAILAAIGAGALNFTMVKDKMDTIRTQREKEKSDKEVAQKDARETHAALKRTNDVLRTTQEVLKTTTEERDQFAAKANSEQKRADTVTEERNKARKERDDAQADLAAYKQTDLTPKQILDLNKQYKALQSENELISKVALERQQKIRSLTNQLAIYQNMEYVVYLPAKLHGKVIVTDPKWNFVIVDIGQDQGVLEQGELLINRNGRLVAKVIVRSVQKDRCIANIMPGWQLSEVMEGDQAIPAHPES